MLLGKERIPLYYQLAEIIIGEIESKGLHEMIGYLLKESTVRNIN